MPNVIRPTFGHPKPDDPTAGEWPSVDAVGQAAGYIVGLIRETGDDGPIIRVIIGIAAGHRVEAVALIPDDHPARLDEALNCAIAALRTLEIVSGDRDSGSEPA